jgi:hypothetical protein
MSIQLAPEVEAGLRAEAQARGLTIDALVATAVNAYLRDNNRVQATTRRVSSRDRSAEMAWLANPDAQFIGKWVVLQGSKVVASGSNPKKLYEEARTAGDQSPFLTFVPAGEQEPFAGGWIA